MTLLATGPISVFQPLSEAEPQKSLFLVDYESSGLVVVWSKSFLISWSGLETRPTIASLAFVLSPLRERDGDGAFRWGHSCKSEREDAARF